MVPVRFFRFLLSGVHQIGHKMLYAMATEEIRRESAVNLGAAVFPQGGFTPPEDVKSPKGGATNGSGTQNRAGWRVQAFCAAKPWRRGNSFAPSRSNKKGIPMDASIHGDGTGGGNRTRTPSLAMDFESTSSTSSNTPAQCPPFRGLHWLLYRMLRKKAIEKRNFFGEKLARNWCRNSPPFMLKCKLYLCGIVSAVSQCPSVRHQPSGST